MHEILHTWVLVTATQGLRSGHSDSTAPWYVTESCAWHVLSCTHNKFGRQVALPKVNKFVMYITLALANRKWGILDCVYIDTCYILTYRTSPKQLIRFMSYLVNKFDQLLVIMDHWATPGTKPQASVPNILPKVVPWYSITIWPWKEWLFFPPPTLAKLLLDD